jgi:hypothetical protein
LTCVTTGAAQSACSIRNSNAHAMVQWRAMSAASQDGLRPTWISASEMKWRRAREVRSQSARSTRVSSHVRHCEAASRHVWAAGRSGSSMSNLGCRPSWGPPRRRILYFMTSNVNERWAGAGVQLSFERPLWVLLGTECIRVAKKPEPEVLPKKRELDHYQ